MNKTLKAVNLHLTKQCNACCKFCFAKFNEVETQISINDWEHILEVLKDAGTEKVNFVGGEPALFSGLQSLIRKAKKLGMTTSIVSNGFNMENVLRKAGDYLDWLGLSLDSLSDATLRYIGRFYRSNQALYISEIFALASKMGIKIKMNTTVCSLNKEDELTAFVEDCGVKRWKIFQVTKVKGENDQYIDSLLITPNEFRQFIARNYINGISIPETTEQMIDSYAMISPAGMFFGNSDNLFHKGIPILDVGVENALAHIGYDFDKLKNRNGLYYWNNKGE